jgi:hypothetical protein
METNKQTHAHTHTYNTHRNRYRPEIANARKAFAVVTPTGVAMDIAVSLDNSTKFAVEPVAQEHLSSANTVSVYMHKRACNALLVHKHACTLKAHRYTYTTNIIRSVQVCANLFYDSFELPTFPAHTHTHTHL